MKAEFVTSCVICGGLSRDMQAHLSTHSFAEVLRYEIRQDLDQVPDEQRPTIVRDIYRSLLGRTSDGRFVLNAEDGQGIYSIEESLGDISTYRLWRAANNCAFSNCPHGTIRAHGV